MAPSLLTIPEILERIFSFLDEYTLRKSVMVCRLWHQMNQRLILRELIWDTHVPAHDIDKLLSKLPDAGRLRWFYNWGLPCNAHRWPDVESWNKLVRALREGMIVKQPTSTQLGNSLRELEVKIGEIRSTGLFDDFPYPPSLISFKLVVLEGSCSFPLGHLLMSCPLLEEFRGEVVQEYLHLAGSFVPSGLEEQGRQFLPLRSLVLRNAVFAQSSLEELLLVTPRIKELKLISLQNPISSNGLRNNSNFSGVHLVQHIQSLLITLSSFHFTGSLIGIPGSNEILRPFTPLETGRSFFAPDLMPSMMKEMDEGANFLTSLDLYWRQGRRDKCVSTSSSLLHRFMCSSRHLLHVRTSNVAFQFEQLDIHHLSPITNPSETASVLTGVWACKDLRTLHLELHGHDQFQLIHDVNSRIVFGYISTVCPRLQDLQLVLPKVCKTHNGKYFNKLGARLMGGFVLLSRLKYLERLWIEFSEIDRLQAHFNWMVPSGRTAEFKVRRQMFTSFWDSTIQKEKLELKDPAETTRFSLMDKYVLHWSELEPTAKRALWQLGLLMEVKTVLEQMDTPDWECWPLLQKMSLNGGFEQDPEAYMRSLYTLKNLNDP